MECKNVKTSIITYGNAHTISHCLWQHWHP